MITLLLTRQILIFFLLMAMGYLLVRLDLLKSSDSHVLSVILVYLVCPAVMINSFQIDYTPEIRDGFLFSIGAALLIHILLFIICRVLKIAFRLSDIEQVSIIYSNAGFLIVPIVMSVLGSEWIIYTSGFLIVQQTFLWTHCLSLVSGQSQWNPKKILGNVNMIAILIGLFCFVLHLQLPEIVTDVFDSLGGMMGAGSMIFLGIMLGDINWKEVFTNRRLYLIAFLRLIAVPVILLIIMKYSGIASLVEDGRTILFISLLATMTPTATTVSLQAQLYGREQHHASQINVMTTIGCLATIPVLTLLYQI